MKHTIKVFFIILLIILFIPSVSSAEQKFKTFSILGNSWSTFKGYTTPKENNQWYPPWDSSCEGYGSGNSCVLVTQTWWHLFATGMHMKLLENRSFSGSPICYDGWGVGDDDAIEYSYIKRVQPMRKDVDLIIVEGGLNDSAVGAKLGEYKYSNWTEEDFKTFRPAVAYVLDYLTSNTKATIVFMECEGMNVEYSKSIKEICKHYNVPVLTLKNIKLTGWHPNYYGMRQIYTSTVKFISKIKKRK